MATSHIITASDKWFLNKETRDPLAQEAFREGDEIVVCAKCRTAQHKASWEMNNSRCCCSGCNHNTTVDFLRFSPAIFNRAGQMQTHKGFRILEPVLLRDRLLRFNFRVPTLFVMVLVPLLMFALLIYYSQMGPGHPRDLSWLQRSLENALENTWANLESRVHLSAQRFLSEIEPSCNRVIAKLSQLLQGIVDKFGTVNQPVGRAGVHFSHIRDLLVQGTDRLSHILDSFPAWFAQNVI